MQLLQKDNMSANVRKLSGIEAWDKYGIEQAWEYTHEQLTAASLTTLSCQHIRMN